MPASSVPPQTSTAPQGSKSRYRAEIDGLRAFAVVAVIINHFNKDLLPSGYLGVDIFFVISGYVITSSLADRKSKNFMDFLTGFYERRIKRLVPALVGFVLINSVLISLFNPEPGVALGLGWRSLFGISNITLFRSATDYFAESTELNPFTHTWSLGVEEQFYLLFPFLIWFSGFGQQKVRGSRNLFFWVAALTIVSLISFIFLYQVNQPAAYFLMPPRFWEMAAGCLIFIGFQKRAKIEQALEKVPPLLVVAAMVGVMFLPTEAAVPATISIAMLSSVLITCLKKGTAAYEFFTLKKVVYVGLLSYSLYLWHWSVLCISRWTIGIHWWSVPIQVVGMVLMAAMSYQWVETPTRKITCLRERWKVLCLGLGVGLLTSATLISFSRSNAIKSVYRGISNDRASEWERIGSNGNKCLSSYEECLQRNSGKGGSGEQVMFWVGDSHTAHFLPIAKTLSDKENISFIAYQSGGDAFQPFPTVNLERKGVSATKYMEERKRLDFSYQRTMPKLKNGDAIIISLNLPGYFADKNNDSSAFNYFTDHGTYTDRASAWSIWRKKLTNLARNAKDRGIKVIVIIPTPQFPEYPGIAVCNDQPFRPFEVEGCKISKSEKEIYGKWSQIIQGLQSTSSDTENIFLFDTRKAFCNSDGKCRNYAGKEILYMDDNHLRKEGALKLYPYFVEYLRSIDLIS